MILLISQYFYIILQVFELDCFYQTEIIKYNVDVMFFQFTDKTGKALGKIDLVNNKKIVVKECFILTIAEILILISFLQKVLDFSHSGIC